MNGRHDNFMVSITPLSGLPGDGVTAVLSSGETAKEHAIEQTRAKVSRMETLRYMRKNKRNKRKKKFDNKISREYFERENNDKTGKAFHWAIGKGSWRTTNIENITEKGKEKCKIGIPPLKFELAAVRSERVQKNKSCVTPFEKEARCGKRVRSKRAVKQRKNISNSNRILETRRFNYRTRTGKRSETVEIRSFSTAKRKNLSKSIRVSHSLVKRNCERKSSIFVKCFTLLETKEVKRDSPKHQGVTTGERKHKGASNSARANRKVRKRKTSMLGTGNLTKLILEPSSLFLRFPSESTDITKGSSNCETCKRAIKLKIPIVSVKKRYSNCIEKSISDIKKLLGSEVTPSMVGKKNNKKPRTPEENQGNPIAKHQSLEDIATGGTARDETIMMYDEDELLADVIDDAINELENTIVRASLNSPIVAMEETIGIVNRSVSEPNVNSENSRNTAQIALSSGQCSISEDENLFGSSQWYTKQRKLEEELRETKRQLKEREEALKMFQHSGAIPKDGNARLPNWNTEPTERGGRTRTEELRQMEALERRSDALRYQNRANNELRSAMAEPRWTLDTEFNSEQVPFQPVNTRIGSDNSRYFGETQVQRGRNVPPRQGGFNASPYDVGNRGRSSTAASNRARNLVEGTQTLVLMPRGYPENPVTEEKFKAIENQLNNLSIHMDRQNPGHNISVSSINYKQGVIFVTVANNATMEWLRMVAERTLDLECHDLAQAPLRTAYQLWYPCDLTTFEECLALISRQHIPTDEWSMLKAYTNKPKAGRRFLFLGGQDLDERISTNGTLQFQFRWKDRKGTIR